MTPRDTLNRKGKEAVVTDTTKDYLPTDELYSLLAEVVAKVPVERSTLPDTPLVRETRAMLEEQVADLLARGLTPEVPHEWS